MRTIVHVRINLVLKEMINYLFGLKIPHPCDIKSDKEIVIRQIVSIGGHNRLSTYSVGGCEEYLKCMGTGADLKA